MFMCSLINSRKMRTASFALVATLSLSACTGEGGNEGLGTLIGAGLGAFIGHEIGGHGDGAVVGTALGTLVGASIGNSVGRKLDERDMMALSRARYDALESSPSGTSSEWYNPDTGNRGSFTPQPAYVDEGEYCREYQQEIIIGGEVENGYGTACRQPDGSWKIISG